MRRRLFEQLLDLEASLSEDSSDPSIPSEDSDDRAFIADEIEVVQSPDSLDELESRAEAMRRCRDGDGSLDVQSPYSSQ